MPMKYVPAEMVLQHNGVCIYHIYRGDIIEEGTRDFHYGLWDGASDDDPDDGEVAFDIRDLPNYDADIPHNDILIEAINQGYLKACEDTSLYGEEPLR